MTPSEILSFWFEPASSDHWFDSTPEFDQLCRDRLENLHEDALAGRLDHWREQADSALALCILLDQVPRNIYRGTARAFSGDEAARHTARQILAQGFDRAYPSDHHRMFAYLPFEHSEDLADQELCLRLFSERTADPLTTDFARRHCEIIRRFGRFPHRNAALGRISTQEEADFLSKPGSAF
jgi:uncharacterized protein (DUF924 family)